jgi:hypothetical protein
MRSPFLNPIRLRGMPYLSSPVIGKKNSVTHSPGEAGFIVERGGNLPRGNPIHFLHNLIDTFI